MHTKVRIAMLGVTLAALATVATPTVAAAHDQPGESSCAREFEEAQRVDMESFRDFDRETWRLSHDEDAITIFASGTVVRGRDNIVAALDGHFTNRNATWTWTELARTIDGCRTAYILYDATYAIPSIGFTQRAIVGVAYTRKHGRWLSVADQSTRLPTA
jgi:hypothetical protein